VCDQLSLTLHGASRVVEVVALLEGAHFIEQSLDVPGAVLVGGHDAG
jgi:hypothetical protein